MVKIWKKEFEDTKGTDIVKDYIRVEVVKYILSFCRTEEKYIKLSNKSLLNLTAFSQQFIIVSQNLKFGPNMGLNVPTPLVCLKSSDEKRDIISYFYGNLKL